MRTTTLNSDGTETVTLWPLEEAKAILWETVKAKREAVQSGGCDTAKGRVDTDTVSRAAMGQRSIEALRAHAGFLPFEASWTMADNSVAVHDGDEFLALHTAVEAHIEAAHATATALRAAIEAATSVADLEAIDIEGAGWPV